MGTKPLVANATLRIGSKGLQLTHRRRAAEAGQRHIVSYAHLLMLIEEAQCQSQPLLPTVARPVQATHLASLQRAVKIRLAHQGGIHPEAHPIHLDALRIALRLVAIQCVHLLETRDTQRGLERS